MKQKLILVLSIAAVVAGAAMILLPCLIGGIISAKSNDMISRFDGLTLSDISCNMQKGAGYDFTAIDDIGADNLYDNLNKIDKSFIIGCIVIKDINLNLPVMKGISQGNLAAGAATMKEGQEMGKGNYALAGHYNKNKNILFGGIMHIKKGCVILITDKKYIYEYIVYDTKISKDNDSIMISDMRSINKGKPIITLMTCYYSSKTGKRFFVTGEFVRKYPYDKNFINL